MPELPYPPVNETAAAAGRPMSRIETALRQLFADELSVVAGDRARRLLDALIAERQAATSTADQRGRSAPAPAVTGDQPASFASQPTGDFMFRRFMRVR